MSQIYSHSALSSFRSCPRKFKFQYIEKTKLPKRVTPDTYVGSAVHKVLNRLYKLAADGIVLPLEEVIRLYDEEWTKVKRETVVVATDFYTVDDYIRLGREMLKRHYEEYKPFTPGTLIGSEQNIMFTLPGTSFRFRAIVDRIMRLEDGTVEIADYKTGQRLVQPQDAVFRHQMGLYQLAVRDRYPQYEEIEVAQYFLRPGEVVRHRMSEEEIDLLIAELRDDILSIHNSARLDDFPTKESGFCNYCDFQAICPAKVHKRLVDESGEDEDALTPPKKAYRLATEYIQAWKELNRAKAAAESLKEQVSEIAAENGWDTIAGDGGKVIVKSKREEKFPSKTADPAAFAELTRLARELGLEDYFKLEVGALMKDIYAKRRIPDDQLDQLEPFVVRSESARVTVKADDTDDDDSDGS